MNKKWLNSLEHLTETGKVGACPFCNSEDTDFSSTKVSGDYGFAVLWCNSCRRSYVISRIKITSETYLDNPIPDKLL